MKYKAHFSSATGDAGQSGDPLLVGQLQEKIHGLELQLQNQIK